MTEPTPATDAGATKPAGEGVDDAELSREVAEQTSNDLAVEEAFTRESDGTDAGTEAAKNLG
jgi:protease I